jgi:hypothetical protein
MPPASSQSTTNDEHVTRAVQPPKNGELDDEAGTGGPLLRTKYENNSGLDELGRNQALNGVSRKIVEEIVRSWTRALLQGLNHQRNGNGDLDIEAGSLGPVPPEQIRNIPVVDTTASQARHGDESETIEWQWTKSNAMTPEQIQMEKERREQIHQSRLRHMPQDMRQKFGRIVATSSPTWKLKILPKLGGSLPWPGSNKEHLFNEERLWKVMQFSL